MAGAEPDFEWVVEAKEAVGGSTPVLLNTGARQDNIAKYLEFADGVIVGSALKVDGYTWNPVDPDRLQAFMKAVDQAI
jgi:predicted TIM-barrel enzyme